MKQWLIFTDLDGSLLDHHDYSYTDAKPAIQRLKNDHIPIIFTTSKTRAEVLALRSEMKNEDPFIVENGAAVLIPKGYFPEMPADCEEYGEFWVYALSKPRQHWLNLLDSMPSEFAASFHNFDAMSLDEIASSTGLSLAQAELANTREYSEPIQWLGNDQDKQAFVEALEAKGGTVLQGGRFLNLSGKHCKGVALKWLAKQYRDFSVPCELSTLALGDSQNDVSMLEVADHACLIRSPSHTPPKLKRDSSYLITSRMGPKGWAQGINNIIYQ